MPIPVPWSLLRSLPPLGAWHRAPVVTCRVGEAPLRARHWECGNERHKPFILRDGKDGGAPSLDGDSPFL